MPKYKQITVAFLLTILTIGMASCKRQNPGQTSPQTPFQATLRLKWVYDPGFAGEMVAAKSGFFHQNGLDVALKPGGFESDPIKLVASGSDTFGVTGADSFLLARAQGVPIVAIAAGYLQTPVVFYVHADSGIKTPRDFAGKKVGYQAGQDTGTVYDALLKKLGLPKSQSKEVPVKYDFTPFLTRQIDVWPGYAATQSYILQREKISYNIIRPADYGLAYLGTVYFTSARFLAEHPEVVQGFVDGLIKGWEYAYMNEDVAIQDIASYDTQTLTPELIRFNLDQQKSYIIPPGHQFCDFDAASMSSLNLSLVDLKLLPVPVDIGSAINLKFLDHHYRPPK